MIIKEFERAVKIYPFAPERLTSDTDEDYERKTLTTGTISVLKIGENTGKISCDFTLPDRAQTPEQFVNFKRKLTSAFDEALVISSQIRAIVKNVENQKDLRSVLAGTHPQFYLDRKTEKVVCRCGYHAVAFRKFYLCSSITVSGDCFFKSR